MFGDNAYTANDIPNMHLMTNELFRERVFNAQLAQLTKQATKRLRSFAVVHSSQAPESSNLRCVRIVTNHRFENRPRKLTGVRRHLIHFDVASREFATDLSPMACAFASICHHCASFECS
jgi:hypothetical protein